MIVAAHGKRLGCADFAAIRAKYLSEREAWSSPT